ncbi:unnamed protein product [Leptidea sinapis]|uniref:Cation efflux protein transmembrane domain-containing protein n=1 Tax=Leptidea sinapis TaxID=189913 RepID=A0A5E4Q107_9NEOP|nr:unnamed protein product [Leptidea sinapis]
MSDELEARMWDEGGSSYERSRGAFYESAFASSEHLDRAPLLSEETYTEVPVATAPDTEEHCHWSRPEPPSAVPQLVTALILCAVFMICEIIGGYLAGSLSVMSDAAHMLSDCGGFALALLAFRCANRPATTRHDDGRVWLWGGLQRASGGLALPVLQTAGTEAGERKPGQRGLRDEGSCCGRGYRGRRRAQTSFRAAGCFWLQYSSSFIRKRR